MRTGSEIAGLLAETGRLLRARWWLLGFWFCTGWALHQLGLWAAARLNTHLVLANLCFVVAVVIKLCSLILMVHCLKPALRIMAPRSAEGGAPRTDSLPVPPPVFGLERPIEVAALAVGPFLAVYAVWGFVDDEVRALFVSNYTVLGLSDISSWSINLDRTRLPFYLGLAVAGWLLRQLIAVVLRHRSIMIISVAGVLAEGLWTFASFVVVIIAVGKIALPWLRDRTVTMEVQASWRDILQALPDWQLLIGRLPDLVDAVVTRAPGAIATVLLLPLMWLALTATVYGWREFRATEVVAGTRASARLERWADRPVTLLRRAGLFATSDLRTKYLPVLQAARLMVRAGPRFLGAYLVLATCLSSLDRLAQIGLTAAIGPQPLGTAVLLDPLQQLLVELVITVASVALYAAAFDRALSDATGGTQRASATTSRPSFTATQTDS